MRLVPVHLRSLVAIAGVVCGCSDSTQLLDDLGHDGTGIAVTIAPLSLLNISDACYSFEVLNGAGSPERVVARGQAITTAVAGHGGSGGPTGLVGDAAIPLCSSQFGDSRGAISYVVPCDASTGNEDHTVTLWLNSVCATGAGWLGADDGGTCVPLHGYVNPCGVDGCKVAATCRDSADTPVSFNLTVMAAAQQGFFDVAVNFDDVFCSAKLDSCYESGEQITLLHDGAGTRQHTAVAAVACSAGTGETSTTLHFTDLVVSCGDPVVAHRLNLGAVTQGGRLAAPNPSLGDLTAAVYFGTEALDGMNKVYTNVAFLIPEGERCVVDWTVVPSASEEAPQPSDGSTGSLSLVAGVVFDPAHAEVTQGSCDNHPLNGEGSGAEGGVVTRYLQLGDEGVAQAIPYTSSLTLGMTQFVGEEPSRGEFVSVWSSEAGSTITLPLIEGGTYDFTVDWGDGSPADAITAWNDAERVHTYAEAGQYTVTITGTIEGWRFGDDPSTSDAEKILDVSSWGPMKFITLPGETSTARFFGATNLQITASDSPDLSTVRSMARDFQGATNFNSDLSGWDVSNVEDMSYLFHAARSFNGDISSWDVSNVTNMSGLLYDARSFNGDISSWDVSSVTNMERLFHSARVFNGDISSWDVSSVTNMSAMFWAGNLGASNFNGDLSSWDVSNVTDMSDMFVSTSFTGDISAWDVSNVTNMYRMFQGNWSFNGDISGWDVSSVTNMNNMLFSARSFNRDLSGWCVTNFTVAPFDFDWGTLVWVLPRPVWGTCPG